MSDKHTSFDNLMAKIMTHNSPENRWAMQTLGITNYGQMILLLQSRDLNKLKQNLCNPIFYSEAPENAFASYNNVGKWLTFVRKLRQFVTNPMSQNEIHASLSHASQPAAPQLRPGSPVLGVVPPMPFPRGITMEDAQTHAAAIDAAFFEPPRSMSVSRPSGGKSIRRRKSIHRRRRKSTHTKRR